MNLSEAFESLNNENNQEGFTGVVTRGNGSGVGFLPNGKHGIAIYLYEDKEVSRLKSGEIDKWQPNINDFIRNDWYVEFVKIKEESVNI